MGYNKHRRHSKRRGRRNSKKHFMNKNIGKPIMNMSRKYMPKVESGIETVGDTVIKKSQQSVPFFKRMMNMFTKKNKKH
jgi:hypothetical protein